MCNVHISFICLLMQSIFKCTHSLNRRQRGWLVTAEHRTNSTHVVLNLKRLLNNHSIFNGLSSQEIKHRPLRPSLGAPRELGTKWKRWTAPEVTTCTSKPSLTRLSLTTAQAASWGGKAGSLWCTQRPRCRSSSSPQLLCTSAALAVPGPATK